ncbi:hypothetical protein FA13DRAFT_1711732 [Coprinellus micaceus]|uniref:CxC2-like cysteine cluster KDZ transposase-associated domain-containing protein n=1 Tax=Coprinellus micaceus TaxID=71717 RepID=A0A4Y7T2M1_COPMI|nr:hypothetical protein FA13DRAFT_1711732 [Coprinellus micaceus]
MGTSEHRSTWTHNSDSCIRKNTNYFFVLVQASKSVKKREKARKSGVKWESGKSRSIFPESDSVLGTADNREKGTKGRQKRKSIMKVNKSGKVPIGVNLNHFHVWLPFAGLSKSNSVDPELSYEKSGMPGMSVPSGRTDVAARSSCGDVHDYERQKEGVKDTHRQNELTVLEYRSIHSLERRLEQRDSELRLETSCPDGHLRRAVYSIGPVIADYPEQVWLSGIVQGWCPKCLARPENLDDPSARRRTHEKTDFAINTYSPTEIWERFGIRDDVVPFTHHFPRADIHELMAPDLLHQLIKGTFKDHIVTWVNEYIHANHPEARALKIIQDIDRRISGVPTFPGLCRFKDGRDFNQWTGDDSKALMKALKLLGQVYIAAIAEYVPERMVQCLAVFMNICYILRRNAISASALTEATAELEKFHELRSVFVEEGQRMLEGTTAWYTVMQMSMSFLDAPAGGEEHGGDTEAGDSEVEMEEDWRLDDVGPVQGPHLASSVKLSQTRERLKNYPRELNELAAAIQEPQFVDAFLQYLHEQRHPTTPIPDPIQQYLSFSGRIYVHHSAVARFFAPSDACGSGGMQRETVRCNRYWKGSVRRDTILVSQSDEPGMYGMIVARLRLLFEFVDAQTKERHKCALVQWFPTQGEEPDPLTGLWKVAPEEEGGVAPLQVISLSTIVRGVHLLPVCGKGRLPESDCYTTALDKFQEYYVNSFIDHHAHELLVV